MPAQAPELEAPPLPGPETVSGEVVDPPARGPRVLSAAQLQAAVVEAASGDRKQIAAVAGVSEGTVKNWRQLPEYQAEVARLAAANATVAGELVQKLREELLDGMREAVKSLVLQLEATTGREDKPNHQIRLAAAKALLESGTSFAQADAARAAAAGGGSAGVVQLQVNVDSKRV